MLAHATRIRNHIRSAYVHVELGINGQRDDSPRNRTRATGPGAVEKPRPGGSAARVTATDSRPEPTDHADAA
jgi:hypothetical protein